MRRRVSILIAVTTNATIARLLDELAVALELTGANPFKVRAHDKAARIIEELPQDLATVSAEELTAIDGIGAGTAAKIREFVESGRIAEHDELWATIPVGLLEVMRVPGLGPKSVKTLWEKGGVVDLATLKAGIENGSLAALPRVGAKTLANIAEAIAFMERSGGRKRIGQALPVAEAIVALLRTVKGAGEIEYAGSLRRGRETIGDIDIVGSGRDPEAIAKRFVTMTGVERVLAEGATKCAVRLDAGLQVDLRLVEPDVHGAALLYFTGSKEHNVALRERAIAMGFRLNEYGLFREKPGDRDDRPPQERGEIPVAAKTEESIYRALELPWIPPELREDRGELTTPIPDLVTLADIRSELHAHTTASDGALTIDELVEAAETRGFHTIAITDHSRSSVQANGLSPERLLEHIEAVKAAAARHPKMQVLVGSEVDIHVDGTLDYDDELLAMLDIVIASPHASLRQDPEKATQRLIRAVSHPLVHILGHPTGRLVNEREGLAPDIEAVAREAAAHGTALEINANDWRLDLRDTHVRVAVEAGCDIAINCDVHGRGNFDMLRYGVLTARRGWLPKVRCVNALDAGGLRAWLGRKRRGG